MERKNIHFPWDVFLCSLEMNLMNHLVWKDSGRGMGKDFLGCSYRNNQWWRAGEVDRRAFHFIVWLHQPHGGWRVQEIFARWW